MDRYGEWREGRGTSRSYIATFWGGALFAFGMALVHSSGLEGRGSSGGGRRKGVSQSAFIERQYGQSHEEIDATLQDFIRAQQLFFVATAPLSAVSHINISPKGLDTLRVLGPHTMAYLDYVGSGTETIAHLRERTRRGHAVCVPRLAANRSVPWTWRGPRAAGSGV